EFLLVLNRSFPSVKTLDLGDVRASSELALDESARHRSRLSERANRRDDRDVLHVLLDDAIRPQEQWLRNDQAEGLRRLEVDAQLDLRRLLHRQVAGLGSLQDSIDVHRRPPEQLRIIRKVRDQATRFDVYSLSDHDRKPMSSRQLDGRGLKRDRLPRK